MSQISTKNTPDRCLLLSPIGVWMPISLRASSLSGGWILWAILSRQKQSTGRSVGAWIDIVHIQRAKRLLSTTDLSIIDISTSVGVEDQSYFSRLFKKETGITPSAYRKKMQG